MKLSSDQKSVLILAVPVAAIAIIARSANFLIYLGVIGIWFWCVRDKKKPAQSASDSNVVYRPVSAAQAEAQIPPIRVPLVNSDQKSVLILAGIVLFFILYGGPQYVFSIPMMIVWLVLGAWFYGVRTKKKPVQPPPLPRC